ncbi:unnamed protein product [Rotaria sordida]|nr:unnamed protein product [Rotaria sordida]
MDTMSFLLGTLLLLLSFNSAESRVQAVLDKNITRSAWQLPITTEDHDKVLTCDQIHAFLSIFSPNEFSSLQSLTLSEIEKQNIEKLKIILPLTSFHMICDKFQDNEIFDVLSMFNLRTLSISSLHSIEKRINDTSNITDLTIHDCSLEHLLYQGVDVGCGRDED